MRQVITSTVAISPVKDLCHVDILVCTNAINAKRKTSHALQKFLKLMNASIPSKYIAINMIKNYARLLVRKCYLVSMLAKTNAIKIVFSINAKSKFQ